LRRFHHLESFWWDSIEARHLPLLQLVNCFAHFPEGDWSVDGREMWALLDEFKDTFVDWSMIENNGRNILFVPTIL
jgi:hypothetical protein